MTHIGQREYPAGAPGFPEQLGDRAPQSSVPAGLPKSPTTLEEVGIDPGLLQHLALKVLYYGSNVTADEIANRMALPLGPTISILDILRKERLCEILGGDAQWPGRLRYALTAAGLERAIAALQQSGYAGPTPVPLLDYLARVRAQSVQDVEIPRAAIEACLSRLVLDQRTINLIGQALTSERAMLLYGDSGNGKSTAAESLRHVLPGHVLIPHAVEVMHQVIQVFDPSTHEEIEIADGAESEEFDHRWVLTRRPVVFAAGELAANHLELILDEVNKTYEAPIQMKANGGLLIIDDFGRQRLDAAYLLNRWIVPLERGIDHLSLNNGSRFETPFDVIPMFLSNKRPSDLADEAFLRRIRYKIEILSPTTELFMEILKRECERSKIAYDAQAAEYFKKEYFDKPKRQMRGCHPRDIVEAIADAARYQGTKAVLSKESVDEACRVYFV